MQNKKNPLLSRSHYRYNFLLRRYAHENRNNLTKSAACLWKFVLSKRQMMGYQFRRERPIDWYIADFACLPLQLVIEVDGITHCNQVQQEKDRKRDQHLKEQGFTTLRFSSSLVLNDIAEVDRTIRAWIEENAVVPPPPPRRRRQRNQD